MELKEIREKLITIEDIFNDNSKIILSEKELKQFLNGVKLKKESKEGTYKIYNTKKEFIGTGNIRRNDLIRDVII